MKRTVPFLLVFAFVPFLSAQIAVPKNVTKSATSAVKQAESVVDQAGDAAFIAARDAFRKAVKDIPFAVNSSELSLNDPSYQVAGISVDQFMKTVVIPALVKLVAVLPADKKVSITGHASATGSEEAAGSFIGNVALSQKRAEAVVAYIVKNSQIDQNRLKVVAKGSSSPVAGVDAKSAKNCRVSLDIQ
jgi:outer membrane protein OmpA-like peptidoglycan-associated protein